MNGRCVSWAAAICLIASASCPASNPCALYNNITTLFSSSGSTTSQHLNIALPAVAHVSMYSGKRRTLHWTVKKSPLVMTVVKTGNAKVLSFQVFTSRHAVQRDCVLIMPCLQLSACFDDLFLSGCEHRLTDDFVATSADH